MSFAGRQVFPHRSDRCRAEQREFVGVLGAGVGVRLAARFNPEFRSVATDLGYAKKTSNDKARRLLGWTPRPAEGAILAAAESMVTKGLLTL